MIRGPSRRGIRFPGAARRGAAWATLTARLFLSLSLSLGLLILEQV